MTLLDLLNVYRITTQNSNLYALLLEMFEAGNVDERIDRDILAKRMLMDCGRREPRYNTTDTFLFFGSVWLESKRANISKTLDLLAITYNPLNEYEEHKIEDIERHHRTSAEESETKTRDVDTTDTLTSTAQDTTSGTETKTDADIKTNNATDEHLVSAENESGVQLRTRDTHNETVGDNLSVSTSNSETTNTSKSNSDHEVIDEDISASKTKEDTTTHDDNIETTIAGHKTAQAELIRAELEKAKLNIYDELIDDFADIMFINVF